MRVLHLRRAFLKPTETFIFNQIKHFDQANSIILARDTENEHAFAGLDVRAYRIQKTGLVHWLSDMKYRTIWQMSVHERAFYVRQVKQVRPDILHAHFAVDAGYFLPLTHRIPIPLVVSCYGYDITKFPRQFFPIGNLLLTRVWQRADLVLAMSNDMRKDLIQLGCPPSKIKVHYYGADLVRFSFVEREFMPERLTVLFVGSIDVEKKGVIYLLEAFAYIARQRPNVRLRLVGRGASSMQSLVSRLNLEKSVSFAGFIEHDHLPKEYASAHIFCHPSVTTKAGDKEGLPGTIVEAMATGLPIVSTNHAGIPEMVENGTHGLIVGERDVNAIAQSLLMLIDNPTLRLSLGRQAAKYAQERANAAYLATHRESLYSEAMTLRKR